jgi:hypothetical protein
MLRVWEQLQDAARDAKQAQIEKGTTVTPPRPQRVERSPGRGNVSKKQIQVANSLTIPTRPNGGLDLRHANKREPNGAQFLFITRAILDNWVRWPNQWSLNLATIYVALTHFVNDEGEPLVTAIPHWLFIGEHGSGKTHTMKVMRALVRDPTGIAISYTMPGVRDALHNHMVPFLDELHRTFTSGRANEPVQRIVAGSYSAESSTLDGIGGGPNDREAFGPMILGAQPKILKFTSDLLDDLWERSIVVEWEKSYDDVPPLDENFRAMAETFRNVLSIWGQSQAPRPTKQNKNPKLWAIHSMPDELAARPAEIANPLLAVADRAQDPMLADNDPSGYDYRWALIARESVVQALKGHGNDPSTVADEVKAQLEAMGLKIGDE